MTRLKPRRKETEKHFKPISYTIKKLPDDFFKRQFTFF